MKFVFVHLFNDRSGSPKVLADVIDVISDQGADYELLTSSHENGFLDKYKDQTRHLFYKRSQNKLLTLFYYLISQVYVFVMCWRYRKQDAIFYVNTMMPFSAGIAGKVFGKKVIFHVHETSLKPALLKRFLSFVIEKTADEVIFVSKYLFETEKFKKPNQCVVYNAVDSLGLNIGDLKNKVFNVLMICSLKEYKGVFEFIQLSHIFLGEQSINFTLVLNADEQEINRIFSAKNITLPKNLVVHSKQSDLFKFYRSAAVVLNLSKPDGWIETFGLTIVEAMSFGKPVIVPPVGGPTEIVKDGVEGFQVSCYELDKIKEKLVLLRDDTDLYDSMSQSALKRANDFSLSEFNKNLLSVINL